MPPADAVYAAATPLLLFHAILSPMAILMRFLPPAMPPPYADVSADDFRHAPFSLDFTPSRIADDEAAILPLLRCRDTMPFIFRSPWLVFAAISLPR
jgi:hypothetical protein